MLKLAKLPDRTPVKVTVTLNPDLHRALRDYASLYRAEYGEGESIADLIPYMRASFLDGDRAFAKARKTDVPSPADEPEPTKRRGRQKKKPTDELLPTYPLPSIQESQP